MKTSSLVRKTLFVGLALLIVLQLVALPLHEWALSQQGYELIHYLPGALATQQVESRIFVPSPDRDFYNIATCFYHYRIQALFLCLSLGITVVACAFVRNSSHDFSNQDYKPLRFRFSSIVSRAPPLSTF